MATAAAETTSALRALLLMLIAPAFGVALGVLLLVAVLLPRMPMGATHRIVEPGRHLALPPAPRPRIAFIGNSIVRDGIDAQIVADAASGDWPAENLALSGCGLNERRILLPRLLASRPDVVAIGLSGTEVCRLDALAPDKAYVYAHAGFVSAWPTGRTAADFPGLAPGSYAALRSSAPEQWVHFRTVPANWLEHGLRLALRSDLRSGYESDWIRPFTRTASIAGPRLARHLDEIEKGLGACASVPWEQGDSVLTALLEDVTTGEATPLLLLLPVHPDLRSSAAPVRARLHTLAVELGRQHSAALVDASDLLGADGFADAVHPNQAGREALSHLVANALPVREAR
jgi:hypothetical protein